MRKRNIVAVFITGITVGLLFGSVVTGSANSNWSKLKTEFFSPLSMAVHQVRARYVEDVSPHKLLIGAYNGMLSQLDKYSSYIPRKRLEEFQGDTEGEFGGLGIQIRFDPVKKVLTVDQPIPGTPAFKQGVLAGDIITKVQEVSSGKVYKTSEFKNVHDAVRILRGKIGTDVTITVIHDKTGKQEKITITRGNITIPGVQSAKMIDPEGKIGYIYISNFHERTAKDLRQSLKKLKQQGMKGLIIDLRFNPGGLLSSAVDVSDMFLTDSTVVSTRGRKSPEETYRTQSKDLLVDAPVAVLVNGYSASASEIVAGALKDNNRAIIVGDTTYGKGSVQSILPLGKNQGALKLTTARYYTPDGVCIEDKGIKPQIEVKLSHDQERHLARKIAAENGYPPVQEDSDEESAKPAPSSSNQNGEDEQKEDKKLNDTQLDSAIDVLKAVIIERQINKLKHTAAN